MREKEILERMRAPSFYQVSPIALYCCIWVALCTSSSGSSSAPCSFFTPFLFYRRNKSVSLWPTPSYVRDKDYWFQPNSFLWRTDRTVEMTMSPLCQQLLSQGRELQWENISKLKTWHYCVNDRSRSRVGSPGADPCITTQRQYRPREERILFQVECVHSFTKI